MIRNGYARHLQANVERTRLVERWQRYPGPVQSLLAALLHGYGLQAAQLAEQAVEEYARHQSPHEKERNDATSPT